MQLTTRHARLAAVTAATLLSTCALATGGAQGETSPVSGSKVTTSVYVYSSNEDCAAQEKNNSEDITPDSAPKSSTTSYSGSITNSSDEDDVTEFTATVTGSASVLTTGGVFARLNLQGSGSAVVDRTGSTTTSACPTAFVDSTYASTTVTVPSGYVTAAATHQGDGQSDFYLQTTPNTPPFLSIDVRNGEPASVRQAYAAAGTYFVSGEVDAGTQTSTTSGKQSYSGSGVVAAVFTKLGGAILPQAGTATPYVVLPATRTCSSGAVTTTVTSKASKIKKITVAVPGTSIRKTVTNPASGVKITVPAGRTAAARVSVGVTLKAGGTKTGTRDYVPCTAPVE